MLGVKKPSKENISTVTKMAVPAMVESFFSSFVALVDSFMVSSLGESAVAAVGLTNQPKLVVIGVFSALSVSVSALVARRLGEKKRDAANSVMITTLFIAILLSLIMAAITIIFAPKIMLLCGANSDTLTYATDYYRIVMAGTIFNSVQFILNAAQRGCGNTKITLVTNTVANVVNVIFNYLLIGGNFGFPALGVRGAAIATSLGAFAAAAVSVGFACKSGIFVNFAYVIKQKIRPSIEALKNIIKLGYGVLIEQLLMRVGFMASALIAADMGTAPFAAYQVAMQILSLSFAFGDGLQQAAIALVGRSLGEKEADKAKNYVNTCQFIGMIISAALIVIFFMISRFVMEMFFDDPQTVEIGVHCLYVVIVILLFHIRQIVNMGALRGAGDTLYTAIISAVCVTIVRTACCYLFAYTCGFGIIGVWIGILSDQVARAIWSTIRFMSGKWMKIKI